MTNILRILMKKLDNKQEEIINIMKTLRINKYIYISEIKTL